MLDDGSTKDDVKVPDNEIGERINKLFIEESKDTSELYHIQAFYLQQLTTLLRRYHPYCHG